MAEDVLLNVFVIIFARWSGGGELVEAGGDLQGEAKAEAEAEAEAAGQGVFREEEEDDSEGGISDGEWNDDQMVSVG